jgi:hypothetical protein
MAGIPIKEASANAENWRKFNAENTVDGIPLNQIFPNAYSVNLADINALLAEGGIAKLRIYFGYHELPPTPVPTPGPTTEYPMCVMLVGVNSDGKDIIYNSGPVSGIYDHCVPCPTTCDATSPLATDPAQSTHGQ